VIVHEQAVPGFVFEIEYQSVFALMTARIAAQLSTIMHLSREAYALLSPLPAEPRGCHGQRDLSRTPLYWARPLLPPPANSFPRIKKRNLGSEPYDEAMMRSDRLCRKSSLTA
jgi:hypothetical protein